MKVLTRFVLLLAIISTYSTQAISQNWNVEQVGSLYDLWSGCFDVAVQGDFAYLATYSSGFSVVDVSDPTAPEIVGNLDFDGGADRISVDGDYACLKAAGFVMVDVSDPTSPVELCTYPVIGLQDVLLVDEYLYVISFTRGLLIFDITDPAAPALISHLEMPYHSRYVAVSGNYAYVTIVGDGICVVDISNPAVPSIVGFVHIYGVEFQDIEYDSGFVYSISGSKAYIIDVSNPYAPFLTSEITVGNPLQGMTKSGQYLYTAGGVNGCHVVDVADPYSPFIVNAFTTPGYPRDLWVSEGHLYLADTESFRIYELSDPQSPAEIAFIDNLGYIRAAEKQGDLVYLCDGNHGLRIVDVSDPAAPFEVSTFFDSSAYNCYQVKATDSLAFLACYNNGFTIVDISNPEVPALVSHTELSSSVMDIAIDGDLAYLANRTYGLRIMDISDPYNPVEIGMVDTPDWAEAVYIVGNYAYVGVWTALAVIDISDPTHPFTVAVSGWGEGKIFSLVVRDNLAYVVGQDEFFQIFDVSDPADPTEVFVKEATYSSTAFDIALDGDFAFIGTNFAGFQVLNISNPHRPVVAGYHELTNSSYGLVEEDGIAYLADLYHFETFDCTEAITPAFFSNNKGRDVLNDLPSSDAITVTPNPFNPTTVFSYKLQVASYINFAVYDVAGRLVETLVDGYRDAGMHEVRFDGSGLASGVYLYRLEVADSGNPTYKTGKMVLLK